MKTNSKAVGMEKEKSEVVLDICGNSFSAILDFINGRLVMYFIEYEEEDDKFIITGNTIKMKIDRSYYIDKEDEENDFDVTESTELDTPVDNDLLEKFNETVIIKYKERVTKRQINESDARQLLSEFLDYIGNVITRGGAIGLAEKVKRALNNENIKVEFPKPEETWNIIDVRKRKLGYW